METLRTLKLLESIHDQYFPLAYWVQRWSGSQGFRFSCQTETLAFRVESLHGRDKAVFIIYLEYPLVCAAVEPAGVTNIIICKTKSGSGNIFSLFSPSEARRREAAVTRE